jgi:hypothetical protein
MPPHCTTGGRYAAPPPSQPGGDQQRRPSAPPSRPADGAGLGLQRGDGRARGHLNADSGLGDWPEGGSGCRLGAALKDNAAMVTKKPKGLGLGLEALLGPKVATRPRPNATARPARSSTRCRPASTSRAPAWTRARCTSWPRASRPGHDAASWCAPSPPTARGYEIIAGERRFRARWPAWRGAGAGARRCPTNPPPRWR